MKTSTHFRDLLARETAHLSLAEQATRDHCLTLALDYATIPGVMAEAISLKLLTLVEDAPYWLRLLVAKASLEAAATETGMFGVAFISKKTHRAGQPLIEWYPSASDARQALAMMRRAHPDARLVDRRAAHAAA